jgi:hypothetical protein
MEKEPEKEIAPRRSLLARHWPLMIAVPFFVLCMEYLFFPWVLDAIESDTYVYWFRVSFYRFPPVLGLCILPMLCCSLLVGIFGSSERGKTPTFWSSVIGLVMLFAANLGACGATIWTVFKTHTHYDSARLNDHMYYASSEWAIGVGSNSKAVFTLHECDRWGIICKAVYSNRYGDLLPQEEYDAIDAELIVDASASTVSLKIDGEIVYTHHSIRDTHQKNAP